MKPAAYTQNLKGDVSVICFEIYLYIVFLSTLNFTAII